MSEVDTGTSELLATVTDGVATITLSRPERRNALTREMLEALGRILAQVERDDAVGCVVLTGAGSAFCAGGDVKGFHERTDEPEPYDRRLQLQRLNHQQTAGRLYHMPKPTVAVLPAGQLRPEAMARAQRLANGPRIAYRYMKENLNRAVGGPLSESLDLEAVHHLRTFDTADHREAARAFVEKRPPNFTGR